MHEQLKCQLRAISLAGPIYGSVGSPATFVLIDCVALACIGGR